MTTYDVAVAGLGGFGSATAYHLASRGLRVLGLDQHPPGHSFGASHGESRIVRQAYFEGSAYVPLLRRTYELWDRLAADVGEPLLVRCGGLFLGRPGTRVFDGSCASAALWSVDHEVLDSAEISERFPQFQPPEGTAALFEPAAGFVGPERAVLAHLQLAARAGADLRHDEPVESWWPGRGSVTVRTARSAYQVGALVLAPGRWSVQLLAAMSLPLRVERRLMHWFRPAGGGTAFEPESFPVWIWDRDDGTAPYGLPSLDSDTVKTSVHYSSIRRPDSWTPQEIVAMLGELLPGMAGEHVRAVDCTYTLTPDEHFVVGRHPQHDNVLVACGFSGHGFKFTPVLGEVLADLAAGNEPSYDLSMFDPTRFTAPAAR